MWLIARHGSDVALVAPYGGSFTSSTSPVYEGYVYTERPVYRPGNTVHWKAIIRRYEGNALIVPHAATVQVTITDDQQNTLFDKPVPVSAEGTVHGDLILAKTASLGAYSIAVHGVSDPEATFGNGSFNVEEYRKPEYEVAVKAEKQHLLEGSANTVTIDSRYFFGEPVAGARVKYTISQSAHFWYDPEEDDGDSHPSQYDNADATPDPGDASSDADAGSNGDQENAGTGHLDENGKLVIKVPTRFDATSHFDKDYVVVAGVTDEAGREISGKYKFLATYGSFRISVEADTSFGQVGQPINFRVTAVDYENRPVQTAIHFALVQTKYAHGEAIKTDAGSADVTTAVDGTASARVNLPLAGSIDVTASASTPEHRTVIDTTYVYVAGPHEIQSDDEVTSDLHTVKIYADKHSYAPGDTAHLSLIGDLQGFSALVTATGYTMEFRKTLTTQGKTLNFDLPITRDSQPDLTVEAVLIKDNALFQARKQLSVPPTQQALQVQITPAATTFQPQQTAAYDIVTLDAVGHPISADLSFGVVDEAIYSLYPDTSGDILKHLYPRREVFSSVESSLTYYFSGEAGLKSPLLAERHARFRPLLAQVKQPDVKAPHIRKDFPDTAAWMPDVHTDASGHARVTLTFPDSLTSWRATVRAITADSRAGSLTNRVIVRKNIIVRMGQPRFLRKGDTVAIPVIVHNYLATAKSVQLSLDATGLDPVSGGPQTILVNPKGEATAIWKLHASAVGTARLLAKAITDEESDALELSLPVKPSGVQKTLNASGTIAGTSDRTIPVAFPAATDPAAHTPHPPGKPVYRRYALSSPPVPLHLSVRVYRADHVQLPAQHSYRGRDQEAWDSPCRCRQPARRPHPGRL